MNGDQRVVLTQQLRLWGLSLVAATVGAVVVSAAGLSAGIVAFLITVTVLGVPLWWYEKRLSRRASSQDPPRRRP